MSLKECLYGEDLLNALLWQQNAILSGFDRLGPRNVIKTRRQKSLKIQYISFAFLASTRPSSRKPQLRVFIRS